MDWNNFWNNISLACFGCILYRVHGLKFPLPSSTQLLPSCILYRVHGLKWTKLITNPPLRLVASFIGCMDWNPPIKNESIESICCILYRVHGLKLRVCFLDAWRLYVASFIGCMDWNNVLFNLQCSLLVASFIGCMDWNFDQTMRRFRYKTVASFTGARIEIIYSHVVSNAFNTAVLDHIAP